MIVYWYLVVFFQIYFAVYTHGLALFIALWKLFLSVLQLFFLPIVF